jgi:hypothetical protein
MKISATNKATGEVIELDADTPEQIVNAWRVAQEYDKAATALKEQLKRLVPNIVNDRGVTDTINDHIFRVSYIQPMTYDKAVLRQVFDEDLLDVMLIPAKTTIDKYLKEHLEELGEDSTKLRQAMIPAGKSYTVIRLEKVQ